MSILGHRLENIRSRHRFRQQLLRWYGEHQRSLPWRESKDPYRIWVSEIMLQQTRVVAVLEYYRRFLKRFPTVLNLAAAEESEVLAVWSGLGYYRRACMLHRAAKLVTAEHGGRLPRTAARLRLLPGIGRYTANAIASIAFGEPLAVVDGNVQRVLERVVGRTLTGQDVWRAAQNLLDSERPGDFNQAMMELGATVCLPGIPLCSRCPIRISCASRGLKRERPDATEQRLRKSATLLLAQKDSTLALRRRSDDERLMPGMWELPQLSRSPRDAPVLRLRHSITRTDWSICVFRRRRLGASAGIRWIPLGEVSQLPLTGLARKILRKFKLLA